MVDCHYSLICSVCLIGLLIIITQHIKYYRKCEYKRNFIILTISCICVCVVDLFWGLFASGILPDSGHLFHLTTLYHLLTGIVAFNFAFFIFYFNKDNFKHLKLIAVLSFPPLLVICGLNIYNYFTRNVFNVNSNGEFFRGNQLYIDIIYFMHYSYYVITFFISLYSYIVASKKEKHFSKAVVLFSVCPMISTYFQYSNPYLPYFSIGYFAACLLVYSFENSYIQVSMLKSSINDQLKDVLNGCTQTIGKETVPENNINQMLKMLVKYYDAEDAFVYEYLDDGYKLSSYYFWSSNNHPRNVVEAIGKLPIETRKEWFDVYQNRSEVYVPDTAAPGVLKSFADYSKKLHIKSCMTIPIFSGGIVKGLISLYDVKNHKNDFTILRAVSFMIYSEIMKRRTLLSANEQRTRIISALSSGFDCIYYINLDEDKITLYRHDEKVARLLNIKDNETVPYSTSYKLYVENIVRPEDQEELLEFGSVSVLKNLLSGRKSVVKKFKSEISGEPEFYEAKWVKVEDVDKEARFVVLGYTNVQSKVMETMQEQKERELIQEQLNTAIEEIEDAVRASQIDKLTGVYNKNAGLSIVEKFLSAKDPEEQYTMLFFDLDNFKEINDTYGHLEGDIILSGVGKAIHSKCRAGDIAIRFGGDEFIIILKGISDVKIAESKARQISEEIKKLGTGKFYFTNCSMGGYITNSNDLQRTMDYADKALYDVKKNGRDGFKIVKEK